MSLNSYNTNQCFSVVPEMVNWEFSNLLGNYSDLYHELLAQPTFWTSQNNFRAYHNNLTKPIINHEVDYNDNIRFTFVNQKYVWGEFEQIIDTMKCTNDGYYQVRDQRHIASGWVIDNNPLSTLGELQSIIQPLLQLKYFTINNVNSNLTCNIKCDSNRKLSYALWFRPLYWKISGFFTFTQFDTLVKYRNQSISLLIPIIEPNGYLDGIIVKQKIVSIPNFDSYIYSWLAKLISWVPKLSSK